MELFLWDNYKETEINEKIKYWVDLWDDLITNFNLRSYGLRLLNPQIVINDIIDEVRFNKLRNEENRQYLLKHLSYFINNDEVIKEHFKVEFSIAREYLNSNKHDYLIQSCHKIQQFFTDGTYFYKTYELLKNILLSPDIKEELYKKIDILSNTLIIEFLLKGYSLEEIKKFPAKIFAGYHMYDETHINTDFPLDIIPDDFGDDLKAYSDTIKKQIDELTVVKRLDKFYYFYEATPSECYYIFQVSGLTGYKNFVLGDVEFYSPLYKQYISDKSPFKDEELFDNKELEHFFNVAVKVARLDDKIAKAIAIEKAEKTLDLIKCLISTETKFEIISDHYLVVDTNNRFIGSSSSVSDRLEWYRKMKSYNLNENERIFNLNNSIFETTIKYLYSKTTEQSFTEQKIAYSLHWFRKAEESKNYEDKLLNYWIVIENLMDFKVGHINKDNIILDKGEESHYSLTKELIPCIELQGFIYSIGWELYGYIQSLIGASIIHIEKGKRSAVELSDATINQCNLNAKPGSQIKLKPFVDNLDKLEKEIERKVIKDKILFVNNFYNNNKFTCKTIKSKMDEIQDDILYIYRYRNKIVHNAHYDTIMLPYYVEKTKKYAKLLLHYVLYEQSKDDQITLKKMFLKLHLDMKIFSKKIEGNDVSDLLDFNF